MKNNEIQCKKIKLILPALLLLIFLCAMPAAASSYELVANTTSDTNGYYSFEDTQNGNYTLVAMNYSDKLRAIEVDVSVNGSALVFK